MAKKTKVVDTCCPASCGDYKPRLYLSLHDQQVAQIKGLIIGEEVTIQVTGKVVGLSQREHQDYDNKEKKMKTGDIDLENYTVEVMGEEAETEFEEMSKDEESDA